MTPETQVTAILDEDEKRLKKAWDDLDNAILIINKAKKLKEDAQGIHTQYDARKNAGYGLLSWLPAIALPSVKPNVERDEEIQFIISLADTFVIKQTTCQYNLVSMNTESTRLKTLAALITSVVHGAYIHVLDRIGSTYRHSWIVRNPEFSRLYALLLEKVGEKTDEEKKACLNALYDHINKEDIKRKIDFGSLSADAVLTNIRAQIGTYTHYLPSKRA